MTSASRASRGWLRLLLIGLIPGCAESGSSAAAVAEARGVPAATRIIDPRRFDDLPVMNAVEQLRIGSLEGAEEYALDRILGLDVDAGGNVFVLERRGVSVFDSTGDVVRRFASPGPGPGELAHPRGLALGGDTVFVLDESLKFFDPSGVYLGHVRPRNEQAVVNEFMASEHIAYTRHGLSIRRLRSQGWTDRQASTFLDTHQLRFIDAVTGAVSPAIHSVRYVVHRLHGMRSLSGRPIGGTRPSIVATRDGRVIMTDTALFDIRVFAADGTLLDRVVSDVERVPVNRQDLADAEEALRLVAGSPDELAALRRGFGSSPRADFRPAIDRIVVGPDGQVLLRRPDLSPRPLAAGDPGQMAMWHVLDDDWQPVAAVWLPLRFEARVFANRQVTGIIHDDDGVATVVRYGLTHAAESPVTSRRIKPGN